MKLYANIIAASLMGMTAATQAAVIAGGNGSFESVSLGASTYPNAWHFNAVTITGWTYTSRETTPIYGGDWFMGGSDYGTASDGNYMVNVGAGDSYFLSTSITGLTIGNSYTVYFDARQRSGGGGNFDVFVDTTIPSGGFNIQPTSTTTWEQQSITFTAEAASHTLTIANCDYVTNVNNTTGAGLMVDNFSVVPEPSAALLGGLGMLALLRRRRA